MSDLLQVLQQAMQAERDGYEFYRMTAQQTEDPQAADVFRHLAAEEQRHFGALQTEYQSLLEAGTWDPSQVWREPWTPPVSQGIFSETFRRRLGGRHMEMAALSIGILLERQSFEFYQRQAEQTKEQEIQRFFRDLAAWEEGHYQMLLREDEALRDAYWQQNRFQPLL